MNELKLPDFIYLVSGSSGHYNELTYWFVAAYLEEQLAEQHCKILNNYFNSEDKNTTYFSQKSLEEKIKKSGWDKQCFIADSDGVVYHVTKIPLALHPDLYLEKHGS